jgi:hypothetical protein
MKKILLLISLMLFSVFAVNHARQIIILHKQGLKPQGISFKQSTPDHLLREGDIIFQSVTSGQGRAIQIATGSKYSHCGIIYKAGNEFYVYEAIQPVQSTSLKQFTARGDDNHYVIKRLKNAKDVLSPSILQKMKAEGEKLNGKNYDLTFEWSDDRIYCSELVWKIYHRGAGLEIGKLSKLREFNLSDELVRIKLNERYADKIPLDESVISPGAIFESENLVTVYTN